MEPITSASFIQKWKDADPEDALGIFKIQESHVFPQMGRDGSFLIVGFVSDGQSAISITANATNGTFSVKKVISYADFSKKRIDDAVQSFSAKGLSDAFLDRFTKDASEALGIEPTAAAEKSDLSDLETYNLFADLKAGHSDIVKKIIDMQKEYKNILAGEFSKKPDKPTVADTSVGKQQPPSLDRGDYKDYAKLRSQSIKKAMQEKWRGISYDKENPIQAKIAQMCYYGKNILLLGETGIGKTFNPVEIASKNNISCEMIQFTSKTDSVDLHGVDVFRKGLFDKEANMFFRHGLLSKLFLNARDRSLNFEPTMGILDELFRAEDMTPLVSSLSVVEDTDEYMLSLPNMVDFVEIETANAGKAWFAVVDNIQRDQQEYVINDGRIELLKSNSKFVCTDRHIKAEMFSRGDLMTIQRKEFEKIAHSSIVKTEQENESIRVPQKALMLVGTSNIGSNYSVNMEVDNAILRRLSRLPVESPSADYMVTRKMQPISGFESGEVKEKIQKIISKFLTMIQENAGQKFKTSSKVNFSTVDDILSGLNIEDPFSPGFGNIYAVLESKAEDFADLDMDMSAADMINDPVIKQIKEAVSVLESMYGSDMLEGNGNQGILFEEEKTKRTTRGGAKRQ
jgi:hypothetical protein